MDRIRNILMTSNTRNEEMTDGYSDDSLSDLLSCVRDLMLSSGRQIKENNSGSRMTADSKNPAANLAAGFLQYPRDWLHSEPVADEKAITAVSLHRVTEMKSVISKKRAAIHRHRRPIEIPKRHSDNHIVVVFCRILRYNE